jgi:tetraacyldisaccharide 4'-kinase
MRFMRINPALLWYGRPCDLARGGRFILLLLLPLSWLYCAIVRLRRWGYRVGRLTSRRLPVPVIVVGNLTVGGTGKTPLVLRLATLLRERGWTPGIVSRGYGGLAAAWPRQALPDSDPALLGDEAVLLARRSGCTVVAGANRVAAAELALRLGGCDILLSDDGLQHYPMARDLEIVMIDGERGFGNGHCLPAGPLREPVSRLANVDLLLYHGGTGHEPRMRLVPGAVVNLRRPQSTRPLADFRGQRVRAVAGIGHPERFFAQLADAGLDIERCPYPDHYRFTAGDLADWPEGPVLMTEKDAVKCAAIGGGDNHWYLPVEAVLDDCFLVSFEAKLAELTLQPCPG